MHHNRQYATYFYITAAVTFADLIFHNLLSLFVSLAYIADLFNISLQHLVIFLIVSASLDIVIFIGAMFSAVYVMRRTVINRLRQNSLLAGLGQIAYGILQINGAVFWFHIRNIMTESIIVGSLFILWGIVTIISGMKLASERRETYQFILQQVDLNGFLTRKKCKDCETAINPLKPNEIKRYIAYLVTPWKVVENKKIVKELKFDDFVVAMDFVNRVAELAEFEGHHPDILIHYNKVMIELWTYAVRGLSESDFIMASKIELL